MHHARTPRTTRADAAHLTPAKARSRIDPRPVLQSARLRGSLAAVLCAAALCSACGGGGDAASDDTGNGPGDGGATLSCDKTLFQAGTVLAVPSSAELTALAGTYRGEEGTYTMTGFVPSGSATLTLGADGKVTYNTTSLTVKSACLQTLAGAGNQVLYLHFTEGHVDIMSDGTMSGVSPADANLAFTGTKG